jgi:hypothetical protein
MHHFNKMLIANFLFIEIDPQLTRATSERLTNMSEVTYSRTWLSDCPFVKKAYPAYSSLNVAFGVYVCVVDAVLPSFPTTLDDGTHLLWIGPPSCCEHSLEDIANFSECTDQTLQSAIAMGTDFLLSNHSNIVSIYPKKSGINGEWCIGVGVVGKGFVPRGELLLPSHICGYKVLISNAFLQFCTNSIDPLKTLTTIYTGCAISPEALSPLSDTSTITTLGGVLRYRSQEYLVTCGHVFVKDSSDDSLLCLGSQVCQPGGLAHLFRNMILNGHRNPFESYATLLTKVMKTK